MHSFTLSQFTPNDKDHELENYDKSSQANSNVLFEGELPSYRLQLCL